VKNVLRNYWFLAGLGEEVKDKPLPRRILDIPLVFFRGQDGNVAALLDRCPHRFAPLSRGRVVEGALECAYHGLRFNSQGRCTRVPILDNGRLSIAVQGFPVSERDGLIWLWPGDPDKADVALIPDLSFLRPNANIEQLRMYMRQESHFSLGVDNLMDPSHTPFLHRNSLSQGTDFFYDLFSNAEYACRNHPGGKIASEWSFRDAEGKCSEDEMFEAIWWPPSVIHQRSRSRIIGEKPADGIYEHYVHFLTPETEHATHYFAIVTYDARGKDPTYVVEQERFFKDRTFLAEDDPLLTDIDRAMDGVELLSLKPVVLPADAAALRVRRAYARLLQDEQSLGDVDHASR